MARLDHLVVRAQTLEAGVAWVEAALGVEMAGGGEHRGYGTHNRLMALGPETYLEVIAPNPQEPAPENHRMFDMDRFSGPPSLSAWVLNVKNARDAMRRAPEGMGEILALARGDFRWLFSFPAQGRLPFGGAFPALIEWQTAHPAPLLPENGCRLEALEIDHPQAGALGAALAPLLDDARLRLKAAPEFAMRAQISTPGGMCLLGAPMPV
ncbi:MAG TPA: VOC family protein [Aliiroseovarius sp.]|nr:VOC family protein [Aliiroseovarius sp.]